SRVSGAPLRLAKTAAESRTPPIRPWTLVLGEHGQRATLELAAGTRVGTEPIAQRCAGVSQNGAGAVLAAGRAYPAYCGDAGSGELPAARCRPLPLLSPSVFVVCGGRGTGAHPEPDAAEPRALPAQDNSAPAPAAVAAAASARPGAQCLSGRRVQQGRQPVAEG